MKSKQKSLSRRGTRRLISVLVTSLLICCGVLALAVSAYNRRIAGAPSSTIAPVSSMPKGDSQSSRRLTAKLSLQPEADRVRRKLGSRFLAKGRELAIMTGTLAVNGQNYAIRITRAQEDDSEQVAIALNNQPASLMWNSKDGAMASGNAASGIERSLIERVALDSPDQFVLAQLRAASYYTLARNVAPVDDENYNGPVWDVVRVTEPSTGEKNSPQSSWRLYYINATTSLIEKVYSQDDTGAIRAELSGWTEQNGEQIPARIVWIKNDQVIMQLDLNAVSYVAR